MQYEHTGYWQSTRVGRAEGVLERERREWEMPTGRGPTFGGEGASF